MAGRVMGIPARSEIILLSDYVVQYPESSNSRPGIDAYTRNFVHRHIPTIIKMGNREKVTG